MASPSGCLRSTAIERRPRSSTCWGSAAPTVRSSRMTSAPMSDRTIPQNGIGPMLASSSTRMPRSGPRGPSGSTAGPGAGDPTMRSSQARTGTVAWRSEDLRPKESRDGHPAGTALRHASARVRRPRRGPLSGGRRAVRHRRRRRVRHRVPRRASRCRGRLPAVTDRAGLSDDGPHQADDGALLGPASGAPQPADAGRGSRRARLDQRRPRRADARHRLPPPRVRHVRRRRSRSGSRYSRKRSASWSGPGAASRSSTRE